MQLDDVFAVVNVAAWVQGSEPVIVGGLQQARRPGAVAFPGFIHKATIIVDILHALRSGCVGPHGQQQPLLHGLYLASHAFCYVTITIIINIAGADIGQSLD